MEQASWMTTGVSPTGWPRRSSPGGCKPGERLPPQRAFARRRRIAGSTAGRVYAELVRRGLVVGEVGRGTFVRAATACRRGGRWPSRPARRARVNLELNYPSAPGQSELLAAGIAPLLRADVLADALRTAPATGTPAAREAAAGLLATVRAGGPAPERFLFAGNARQAIAARPRPPRTARGPRRRRGAHVSAGQGDRRHGSA